MEGPPLGAALLFRFFPRRCWQAEAELASPAHIQGPVVIAADDTAILRQEVVADTGIFDIGGQHRLAVRRRFDPAFDDLAWAFLAGREIFQDRLPAISGARGALLFLGF